MTALRQSGGTRPWPPTASRSPSRKERIATAAGHQAAFLATAALLLVAAAVPAVSKPRHRRADAPGQVVHAVR